MPREYIDPSTIDWSQYRPVQKSSIDVNKLNPETSNLQEGLKSAGKFTAGLASTAAGGIAAPEALAGRIMEGVDYLTGAKRSDKYLAQRELNQQRPAEIRKNTAKNIFGLSEQDIEPENFISEGLQGAAGNLPLLAATGGLNAASIGADALGSVFSSGAKALGFGRLGQAIAGIFGATTGFTKASQYLSKAPKDVAGREKYISSLYDKEAQLGSRIPVSPVKPTQEIFNIKDQLRKEYVNPGKFDEAARNRVLTNLETAEKSLTKPNLTAADIFKEKKNLNNAWSYKNSIENQYYQKIRNVFKNELEDISKSHPDWGTTYKTADKLYEIQNWQSDLSRWADNQLSKGKFASIVPNPLAQGALGLLGGFLKGTPGGIIGAAAPAIGKIGAIGAIKGSQAIAREAKFLHQMLFNTPNGKKVLAELIAASASKNANKIALASAKVSKLADKFDKENPAPKREYIDPSQIDWSKYKPVKQV